MLVIDQEGLSLSGRTRELEGDAHGGAGVSFILDDQELEVTAGQIVVVPAGRPHRFVNSGDGALRQIDIHASSHFITEWLES